MLCVWFFCLLFITGPEVRQVRGAILVPQLPYNFHYQVIFIALCIYHCIVCDIGNTFYSFLPLDPPLLYILGKQPRDIHIFSLFLSDLIL